MKKIIDDIIFECHKIEEDEKKEKYEIIRINKYNSWKTIQFLYFNKETNKYENGISIHDSLDESMIDACNRHIRMLNSLE